MSSHIACLSVQLCCVCATLVTRPQPPAEPIPQQIIYTGWQDKVEDLEDEERANVMQTMQMNPGFSLRYLGDEPCYSFIAESFASDSDPLLARLPEFYKNEKMGMRRGDICRAAVLFREGGHYADLDMVFVKNFSEFVLPGSGQSDFVTSLDVHNRVFNAIQLGTKRHPIFEKSLKHLATRYASGHAADSGMAGDAGVLALSDAINEFHDENCPEVMSLAMSTTSIAEQATIQNCGPHRVRIFKEKRCTDVATGCPGQRGEHAASQYGVYDGDSVMVWSRPENCTKLGCGFTGRIKASHFDGRQLVKVGPNGKFGFTSA